MRNLYVIKGNVVKHMRSYPFLITIVLTLFAGYISVPESDAEYAVFYIGGVRGVYNSAWLGGMAAIASSLILWLFGFYLLRSQVSEDHRLKVSDVIASSPASNIRYIFNRALSNFVIAVFIAGLLMLALMGMQFIRGEDHVLMLWDYLGPFLFISVPSLFVLAAFTILFDVVHWLKGTIGNILFFIVWLYLSVSSITKPGSMLDVLGIETVMSKAVKDAGAAVPLIRQTGQGAGFGYNPMEGGAQTFIWQGLEWDSHIIVSRVICIVAAIVLIMVSALLFDRFKKQKKGETDSLAMIFKDKKALEVESGRKQSYDLSPIKRAKQVRIFSLILAELRVSLKGYSLWMYALLLGAILLTFFVPFRTLEIGVSFILVLPIAMWSQVSTRQKHYFVQELLISCGTALPRFFAMWIASVLIGMIVSLGVIGRLLMDGNISMLISWLVGVLFISTLAIALGLLSGTKKLFEVIFLLWLYIGPMNGIPYLDFLGITSNHVTLYSIFTGVLFIIALYCNQLRMKNV